MNYLKKYYFILMSIYFIFEGFCDNVPLPSCQGNDLKDCGNISNAICNEVSHQCECLPEFEFNPSYTVIKDACVHPGDKHLPEPESRTVPIVLILLATLTLVICALFIINRRYHLGDWIRQKLLRRNSTVTYEDVMIGQDDPPIPA